MMDTLSIWEPGVYLVGQCEFSAADTKPRPPVFPLNELSSFVLLPLLLGSPHTPSRAPRNTTYRTARLNISIETLDLLIWLPPRLLFCDVASPSRRCLDGKGKDVAVGGPSHQQSMAPSWGLGSCKAAVVGQVELGQHDFGMWGGPI